MNKKEMLARRRARQAAARGGGTGISPDRKSMLARRKARQEQAAPVPEQSAQLPEGAVSNEVFDRVGADGNEYSGWNDPSMARGGAREMFSFPTLSAGDEIEAAVRSVPALMPGGETPGEAYGRNYRQIKDEMKDFRKEHPRDANVSALAGALYTMALPGGKGAMAENLTARFAPKALPALSKALRLGTTSNLGKTARSIAQGTGMGALTGFLAGDEGDRIGEAYGGGMIGGGLGTAGAAVGAGLRELGKRRVVQKLYDKVKDEFTAIGTAEGTPEWIKKGYQYISKLSPKYRRQVEDVVERAKAKKPGLEKSVRDIKNAQGDQLKADIRAEQGRSKAAIAAEEAATEAPMKKAADRAKSRERRLKKTLADRKNKANVETSRAIEGEQELTEEYLAALDRGTRKQVIKDSLPAAVGAKEADDISRMNPQQAMKEVNKKWGRPEEGGVAFGSVRANEGGFEIPLVKIADNVKKEVEEVGGGRYFGEIMEDIKNTVFRKMKDGKLTAEEMLEARNSLGRMASKISEGEGGAAIKRAAINRAKDNLDDIILEGLPTQAAKDEFMKDLSNYRQRMVYKKAAKGATGGEFTAEDYNRALGNKQSEKYLIGEADNQKLTEKVLEQKDTLKKASAGKQGAISEKGGRTVDELGEKAEDVKGIINKRLEKSTKAIQDKKNARILAEQERSIETIDNLKKYVRDNPATVGSQEYKDLQKLTKYIKEISPKAKGTDAGDLALGTLIVNALGAVPTALAAAGTAMGASSRAFQKALAGQTGWQDKLRKNLAGKGFTGKALDDEVDSIMRAITRYLENERNL